MVGAWVKVIASKELGSGGFWIHLTDFLLDLEMFLEIQPKATGDHRWPWLTPHTMSRYDVCRTGSSPRRYVA